MKITLRHAAQVRIAIKKEPAAEPEGVFLSTGSTLLNLAISDRVDGGLPQGKYILLVGDSNSGKTFLSMTCLAEAGRNPAFRDHRLILNNVEDGMMMNVERLFGRRVDERLKFAQSETIEDFYYHIDDVIARGKPFIYILDSMDGLGSEAEEEKFSEQKEAHRKGKETAGSYGDGKAKKNSSGIRRLLKGLRATGSVLVVISQTRDVLNAAPWGPKKTRSGGRALKFYASVEIWTAPTGSVGRTVRGKARKIGTGVKLQVVKNRITGKLHEVETTIYPSYGIDDLGSCIDYLLSEKWWTKSGKTINAKDLATKGTKDDLIDLCERDDSKRQGLLAAVQTCWTEVEKAKDLVRRPRYE